MSYPLPDVIEGYIPDGKNRKANYGLLFTRFFDGFTKGYTEVPPEAKSSFLKRMVEGGGKCGDEAAIKQASSRQVALTTALQGESACFACDWHFVTGMGNEHPVENGFTWHPTLGTPYIPGSTVKGLVRAWMEEFPDQSKTECQQHEQRKQWFGSKLKPGASSDDNQKASSEDNQTGELIFFDALPINEPKLAIDIMTPHMGKWYEKGDDAGQVMNADIMPGDWHAPVPVPFLVTRKACFLFSVAPRAGFNPDMLKVMEALENALAWLGVGSKTAVGYGHMERDDSGLKRIQDDVAEQQRKAADEAENAQLSPQALKVKEIRQQFETEQEKNPGAPSRQSLNALSQQDLSAWEDADKQSLLAVAKLVFDLHGGDKPTPREKKNKTPALKQRLRTALGL